MRRNKGRVRDGAVSFFLSRQEREVLRQEARRLDLSLSELLRRSVRVALPTLRERMVGSEEATLE